jgi:hypothetical protein
MVASHITTELPWAFGAGKAFALAMMSISFVFGPSPLSP